MSQCCLALKSFTNENTTYCKLSWAKHKWELTRIQTLTWNSPKTSMLLATLANSHAPSSNLNLLIYVYYSWESPRVFSRLIRADASWRELSWNSHPSNSWQLLLSFSQGSSLHSPGPLLSGQLLMTSLSHPSSMWKYPLSNKTKQNHNSGWKENEI